MPETLELQARAFKAGHAAGRDWATAVKAALDSLGEVPSGANLGFLYATDALAPDLSSILTFVREKTGVAHWAGTVGTGVAASGVEHHDRPALALMVAALPEDAFRIAPPVTAAGGLDDVRAVLAAWGSTAPTFGIVHGDPRGAEVEAIVHAVAAETDAFLVGGLSASRGEHPQVAGGVSEGGLSGVLFAPEVAVVTGLTQGCSPIGDYRTITDAEENVIKTIDGRPALEVFKADIGELLARDLRRVGGYIFAAFPVRGSDTGDYLVRNLTAIDPAQGWIAVAEHVGPGDRLVFCRRDHDSALADLARMVRDVKRRAGARPKAALYYSCVARGPNLFGANAEELSVVQRELGDVPLAGFFGNGEISHDRLYGYTGVLAAFV